MPNDIHRVNGSVYRQTAADKKQEEEPMEAIRVTDKEWEIAGVHYVRTEAMCNGFGV